MSPDASLPSVHIWYNRLGLMMPLWSLGEMDLHQVAEEAGTRDVEAWQVACQWKHRRWFGCSNSSQSVAMPDYPQWWG